MKPLLLLTLALAAPVFAEDPPAGPRDVAALKAELGKDFAGGVSLKQNRLKWTPDEIKNGVGLEAVIARGVAVQEVATVPADISAYEKQVHAVAAALGLDGTGQARAAVTYLTRLRAGGSVAMTADQKAAVEARLAANRFSADNPSALRVAKSIAGDLSGVALSATMPLPLAGRPATPDLYVPDPALRIGKKDDAAAAAAAIGVEAGRVKQEQAGLAARFNPDLDVPEVAGKPVKKDDVPWYAIWQGENSTLGQIARSVRKMPVVGTVLDFAGDTASTVYSGVGNVVGAAAVELPRENDRIPDSTLDAMLKHSSILSESSPLMLLMPGFSGGARLLHATKDANQPASQTMRAFTYGLVDPGNMLGLYNPPGATIVVKRVPKNLVEREIDPPVPAGR